jgi:glycosyltransferase involved in cell wall biosynthesis
MYAKGVRIVWTAHNLFPHEKCLIPIFDLVSRLLIIRLSRIILVHGSGAASALQARFPHVQGKLVSIPLGNWIGYYPSTLTKDEARRRLGISPDKPLFLFIGLCKPYKNLEHLVSVFHASDLDATLIIAGKFSDPSYKSKIDALLDDDHRIILHPGFIPDNHMQDYLKACDYVVVPYREILTSGTAMLALSFGRPVISVSFGFLRDVISDEAGILFSSEAQNGLAVALTKATRLQFDEGAIIAHASKFSFKDAAHIFANSLCSFESLGS